MVLLGPSGATITSSPSVPVVSWPLVGPTTVAVSPCRSRPGPRRPPRPGAELAGRDGQAVSTHATMRAQKWLVASSSEREPRGSGPPRVFSSAQRRAGRMLEPALQRCLRHTTRCDCSADRLELPLRRRRDRRTSRLRRLDLHPRQDPVEPGRQPPVRSRRAGVIVAGTRIIRTRVASRKMATAIPNPSILTTTPSSVTKPRKTGHHDRRGGGDHPAGRRRARGPRCRARRRCARSPPGSARAGTPRSPSTGRTGWRTSGSAASVDTGIAWSSPSSSAPQPHWKTAVSTPYAAATDSRFITAALSGIDDRAEHHHQQQHRDADDEADHQPDPARQDVGDVGEQRRRCRSARRPAGSSARRSATRSGDPLVVVAQHGLGRDECDGAVRRDHRRDDTVDDVVARAASLRGQPRLRRRRRRRGRRRTCSGALAPGPNSAVIRSNDCAEVVPGDLVAAAACGQVRMSSTGRGQQHHHGRGADQPRQRPARQPAVPSARSWSVSGRAGREAGGLPASLRARRTARGSIQRRVRPKSAGTSSRAVTMTATTVIAVANPKAPKVDKPGQPQAQQRDQHGGAGEDDRAPSGDDWRRRPRRRRRSRRGGTPAPGRGSAARSRCPTPRPTMVATVGANGLTDITPHRSAMPAAPTAEAGDARRRPAVRRRRPSGTSAAGSAGPPRCR